MLRGKIKKKKVKRNVIPRGPPRLKFSQQYDRKKQRKKTRKKTFSIASNIVSPDSEDPPRYGQVALVPFFGENLHSVCAEPQQLADIVIQSALVSTGAVQPH